jgi:hypothetical protein
MADWTGSPIDKMDVLKEEKPLLYDAKGKPLVRPAGFRAEQNKNG